jgi:aspartate 1-decarboxylase
MALHIAEMTKIHVVRAKLHGLTVTGADLDYQGSITLDPLHCRRAGIYPLEFVDIWNKASGARISTYVIYGEPGSGCCILNGAAARTCQRGDVIIVAAAADIEPAALVDLRPKVLVMGPGNTVAQELAYEVSLNAEGEHDFRIVDEATGQTVKPGGF